MASIKPEFDRRGVKIIGLSVDPVDRQAKWAEDIRETQGFAPNFPMIGDPNLSISKLYGMLSASVARVDCTRHSRTEEALEKQVSLPKTLSGENSREIGNRGMLASDGYDSQSADRRPTRLH